ncbi:MAG: ABC transporter permease [Tannerella sp.]|jgi:ABC-type lipoprotein release transport system permease subunit|nr:ABC transporter permease [Tannerella sp.]
MKTKKQLKEARPNNEQMAKTRRFPLFIIHYSFFVIHYSLFTIKLCWRNIWRNRRRAFITIASVFFAVFFCTINTCWMEGMWDKMIENTLRTQTGHIQIHLKGYWDDKIIDNFMTVDGETIACLGEINHIENVSPRIETFAMASFGAVSKGIALVGISPAKEAGKSNLPARLVAGEYLSETDDGILIGEGLGKYLKAGVGDTLAFIGQGYHGVSAAGLFPIRGILELLTPEMDNGFAYMTLPSAQQFIDMPDGYSGILIALDDNDLLDGTIEAVRQAVDTQALDVLPWHFTMERLLQTAESDKVFNKLIMYILYLIVAFGILGTVIMMTNERKREFCVLISLGMGRLKLTSVVAMELLIMTLSGMALALLVTIPVAYWFALHPIELGGEMAAVYASYGMEPLMPLSTDAVHFVKQALIVFVLTCLTMIYPVRVIKRLKITDKQ